MRAVHIFLTFALSLSTTARDTNTRLLRKDVVPTNDGIVISNRDLFVFPRTSNTSNADDDSDANSLHTRALDGHSLNPRAGSGGPKIVRLTLSRGLFTTTVSFGGQPVSKVVLDTAASFTWARTTPSAANDPRGHLFIALTFYKLHGVASKRSTVKIIQGLTSQMQFLRVGGQESDSDQYDGTIALDRSPTSWTKFVLNQIPTVFAFYSVGRKAYFDYGGIEPKFSNRIEWHGVADGSLWTPTDKATIKVHGVEVDRVVPFFTVLNSGVPYTYGGAKEVATVYHRIPNSKFLKQSNNRMAWMVPCDEKPVVSFSWGKRDYYIEDFLMSAHSTIIDDKKYCRGTLRTRRDLIDNHFMLGAGFFYDKYVAFDSERKEVGFVKIVAAQQQQSSQ